MSLKKYFRRNIYKWHRITSLIIALPVLLWTLSGFLHPVMGSLKPAVKNSFLPAAVIDTTKLKLSLHEALVQNGIRQFRHFRLVKMQDEFYYQVAQNGQDSLTYISCATGTLLSNGDRLYAASLAQRFLSEENGTDRQQNTAHHHGVMTASFTGASMAAEKATTTNSRSKILSTKLLTQFSGNYRRSNKILPVYEVAFDHEDGITLYIETGANRLVLTSDNNKRWFSAFFSFTHSWSFLDGLGKTKSFLLGSFSALCFLSSVFGFAVYNVLHKKKATTAGKRWHRWLGNVFLLTTLLYAFSGAWHAFAKLPEKPAAPSVAKASFSTEDLPPTLPFSTRLPGEKLTNVSIVKIDNENFWQISYEKGQGKGKRYVNIITGDGLPDGDIQYAASIACQLKGTSSPSAILHTKTLTAFNHSYSMMNKRLPVVEVAFRDGDNYYIETAAGSLAAITRPANKAERFSFSNLHMHHYWEMWLDKENGKTARNTVLIATTLGLLLLALTGMFIYARKKIQKG